MQHEHKFLIVLGNKKLSSWSLRVWLMLKYLGATFAEHTIDLNTSTAKAKILKYSPSGKIPVLMHNGNAIWESLAIAEYLNELFPKAGLWPLNINARAFARSISNEMHAGFMQLRKMMPFSIGTSIKVPLSKDLTTEIKRIEDIWQQCRVKYSTPGQYLFNTFTIADAMFAPIILRFKTYNYYSKNPAVLDYCNTILNNQFIQEWLFKM